jgi:CTD kinase subunit alpha
MIQQQSSPSPMQQSPQHRGFSGSQDDEGDLFRPSKDLQVEDQDSKTESESGDRQKMPPPIQQQNKDSSKFSFAFKAKAAPNPPVKPPPDLSQRMRDPPRPADDPKSRIPEPRPKQDPRFDRNDRKPDRKDHRRDDRRDDRRWDNDRRPQRDDNRRSDNRYERPHERPPPAKVVMVKEKIIKKRKKPRPTLPPDMATSDSVYYRKPGNESVVGSGTYGKVFKAIHVYTKNKFKKSWWKKTSASWCSSIFRTT